jgi:AcrR family transcriptional regulator
MADTVSGTSSRRDAQKIKTRRALRDAALKLFAAKGYDATTAEEIAEEVGVSVRTFFRYFPLKESVLFSGKHAWIQSFADLCRAQSAALTDLDAMCAALVAATADIDRSRRSMRLYERAVASSPTLRGLAQDHYEHDMDRVAHAIAARHGLARADRSSTLLASVGMLIYRRALDTWLAGPLDAQLGDVIAENFRLLAGAISQTDTAEAPERNTSASLPRAKALAD